MQLASAAQMRELDRQTIEEIGLPGMVLMENAGRATVDLMQRVFGPVAGRTVCVFAGPGNNGGDGLVIARTVHGLGAFPFIFLLVRPDQLQGDAARNFAIASALRLPCQVFDQPGRIPALLDTVLTLNRMHPVHSLVDALFGTGLTRPVEGHFLDAINCLNSLRENNSLPVVAVDLPSGLNSDTGAVLGGAVQADLTVTYAQPKPGHYHHGGPQVGRVERVDIGIPAKLVARAGLRGATLAGATIDLRDERRKDVHKGTNGHLLIVAGSEGKTGAALLCGRGALRCGTGLVSFAVPRDLNPVFEVASAETMSIALPASSRWLSVEDYDQIKAAAEGKHSLVLGPGLGTEPATTDLVLRLYTENPLPQVVDADALNILAAHPEVIRRPAGPRVFTPHPGEMARLLGSTVAAVQNDRLAAAQWLNDLAGEGLPPLVTVLKGAGTVVASVQGRWAINTSGNPGMGTGGMGDVLSGVIGGLLAQGYPPWNAACLGVYLHGHAADRIARTRPFGYTASEVAEMLPEVIGACRAQPHKERPCSQPRTS